MVEYANVGSVRVDVADVNVGESIEEGVWGDLPLSRRKEVKTVLTTLPYTLDDRIQECLYDHPRIFYVRTLNMVHSVIGQCHYWQNKICAPDAISISYLGLTRYKDMPKLIRHYKEMAKFISARISLFDKELAESNKEVK